MKHPVFHHLLLAAFFCALSGCVGLQPYEAQRNTARAAEAVTARELADLQAIFDFAADGLKPGRCRLDPSQSNEDAAWLRDVLPKSFAHPPANPPEPWFVFLRAGEDSSLVLAYDAPSHRLSVLPDTAYTARNGIPHSLHLKRTRAGYDLLMTHGCLLTPVRVTVKSDGRLLLASGIP